MSDSRPTYEDIRVISCGQEQIEDLTLLFDGYRVFYEQPSDKRGARTFLLERIREQDAVIYMAVATTNRKTVPLGFTQLYPSHSSVSMKRLWILNDLYVVAEARKLGVARMLIDRARRLATDTGAKGLILETAMDNHPAQRLYDKYGFVRDTEFYRYSLDT